MRRLWIFLKILLNVVWKSWPPLSIDSEFLWKFLWKCQNHDQGVACLPNDTSITAVWAQVHETFWDIKWCNYMSSDISLGECWVYQHELLGVPYAFAPWWCSRHVIWHSTQWSVVRAPPPARPHWQVDIPADMKWCNYMSKDISPSVKIAEVGRARRASAVFFSLKASWHASSCRPYCTCLQMSNDV